VLDEGRCRILLDAAQRTINRLRNDRGLTPPPRPPPPDTLAAPPADRKAYAPPPVGQPTTSQCAIVDLLG
jgi:hypothetical protein